MTLQYSLNVNNARLDQIETAIGTAPILELRDADPPANCAAAPAGNVLAQFALPSDWMAAASGASKAKTGTWSGTAVGTGPIRSFRIYESGSPSVCHMQGTVGPTGSPSYDMTVDNVNVAPGQTVTVSSFTITTANT